MAECGGMIYLSQGICQDGQPDFLPMAGVLPFSISNRKEDRRLSLGYRRFDYNGQTLYGHEFHYTQYVQLQTTEFDSLTQNADGTYTLPIPSLHKYSCTNIKLKTLDANGEVLETIIYKVPIIVNQNATTAAEAFFYYEGDTCKNCDVVIRDEATLTAEATGKSEFRNVEVYPQATLAVPESESLTVHSLAIKRAAKMGQEKSSTGSIAALAGDPAVMARELSAMIEEAYRAAESMGLSPYYLYRQKNIAGNFENVGFAKVDKAGIYNILIMEEKQSIIAAGAGSSTKILLDEPILVPGSRHGRKTTLVRVENVKNIREYIARIDEMINRKGEWLWR